MGGLVRYRGVEHQQRDFAEFYASSRDACLRAVTASVGDPQLAEDLVAEAFARAWTGWRKVSQHPAPRAWIVRTALNLGVSWWRGRRREVPLADHDRAAGALSPAPGLGQGLDAATLAALRRLPARQREVVALRVFLDLDTAATASVLGIAPGTVTAHLTRATAALRRDLAQHETASPLGKELS
ncbi:MAG TPA: SigE family RNA polymerase sigma factor [Streptosporangiaceae bacterium]|jgi:RNA polymerase sigma-70 factor (sigma-E family)|nr:SigE family RNA polymerase sigma factor [Streptosporangiaceae bacterium]